MSLASIVFQCPSGDQQPDSFGERLLLRPIRVPIGEDFLSFCLNLTISR